MTNRQKTSWFTDHKLRCAICQHSRGSIANVCELAFRILWPKRVKEAAS